MTQDRQNLFGLVFLAFRTHETSPKAVTTSSNTRFVVSRMLCIFLKKIDDFLPAIVVFTTNSYRGHHCLAQFPSLIHTKCPLGVRYSSDTGLPFVE